MGPLYVIGFVFTFCVMLFAAGRAGKLRQFWWGMALMACLLWPLFWIGFTAKIIFPDRRR